MLQCYSQKANLQSENQNILHLQEKLEFISVAHWLFSCNWMKSKPLKSLSVIDSKILKWFIKYLKKGLNPS
jgi:hypothetical protein